MNIWRGALAALLVMNSLSASPASPASPAASALDLNALWNFSQPAESEQRFRAALASAQGDDILILKTQIARTYGLRRDFDRARAELADIEAAVATAGPEARVRYALELGRTWSSATHDEASQTDDARQRARSAYEQALAAAREAELDALAIDAVHMLAFVDSAPADQLKWAQVALALALNSVQPAAQRWEASIRNNLGYALHQLGRFEPALAEFEQAMALRQKSGDASRTRQARWMVAWTLRSLDRSDEALTMQLALEVENDAAGTPDVYVFEELAALYQQKNETALAEHYAQRAVAVKAK